MPPLVGSGHFFEQPPQFLGSVSRLTQVFSHWVGRVPEQETVQPVLEQSGVEDGQAVEQPPQCSGLLMSVSQPSSGLVLQCA
jgi:hypothetical protein